MFSRLKRIILNRSNSFHFYKEKCTLLLQDNKSKDKRINFLRNENEHLKNTVYSLSQINQSQEQKINKLLDNSYSMLSSQNEHSLLLSMILSNDKKLTENVFAQLAETSLNIEKNVMHNNIKMDSRFMEQKRFIEELFDSKY